VSFQSVMMNECGALVKWPKLKDVEVNLQLHWDLCSDKTWGLNGSWAQEIFLFLLNVQTSSEAHPASYSVGTRVFSWVKSAGAKVEHSSPSSAQFRNEWIFASSSTLCLHCMDRDNFTCFAITFDRQIIIRNEIWLLLLQSFNTDETVVIQWERTHCSLWKEAASHVSTTAVHCKM